MAKKAAVIRGDGIGPEIVEAMIGVLDRCNMSSELILCEAGSEQWDKGGRRDDSYIPADTMQTLKECDACFKGPTTTLPVPGAPRSVAVTLRQHFDLYANIRPIRTYDRLTPSLNLECACFREATEGLYTGIEAEISDEAAIAIRKITRRGSARIAGAAFDWAERYGLKKMVAVTKRNILKQTDGIFWSAVQEASEGRQGIEVSEIYIDNMAQQLVVAPEQFDGAVLVSTNLFMDIISELVSGLVGSIGLVYSANMGDGYAMFEAAHGSAPDIAGKQKANPTAAILSGAWMAEYLGHRDIRDAIFDAVRDVIGEGKYITADIGGQASTTQMAQAVADRAASGL